MLSDMTFHFICISFKFAGGQSLYVIYEFCNYFLIIWLCFRSSEQQFDQENIVNI